jgi:anaerobic carbon-monoxide dehydrogenase iron sulfur subunit
MSTLTMKRIYCDLDKCMNCRRCELACYMKNAGTEDINSAVKLDKKLFKNIDLIRVHDTSMPLSCRQCDEPLCVDACISGALRIDEEKNIVVIDKDKCVGCYSCIMRCKYGSIKASGHDVSKCDLCSSNDKAACIEACPTKALYIE